MKKQLLKKFYAFIFALMMFSASANAQSKEQISYYYKGKKVYYPVSYDRLIIEIAPGRSFAELKSSIANLIAISEDSLQEISFANQVLVKFGKNVRKTEVASAVTKLKSSPDLLYARPVFKTPSGKYVSYGREFIVKLKKSTRFDKVQDLMDKTGCKLVKKYPFQDDIYILAAGKQSGYDGLAMANIFYESQLFDYAEPNKNIYDAQTSAPPNDPLYDLQWAHNNTGSAAQHNGTPGVDMKILQAWDISMGNPNIKIGVIDEGVDLTHPDLQSNLLQGFNGFTMTSNPGDGGYTNPTDAHGTACAGIMAAIANNGIGVAGIAPNCKIIPAVAFTDTAPYFTDVAGAACFDYLRLQGADIISNSWTAEVSSILDDAIDRAVTLGRGGKGCVVFFASGNSNSSVFYPASNPQVIAVGGISMCGERKSYTSCDGDPWGACYGPGLDVVAPCELIATTDIQGADGFITNSGTAGDYVNDFSGTSASSPSAAGVMALILSVDSTLTVSEATRILELSCTKLPLYNYAPAPDPNQPNGTWNNETGHGLINAYAALQLAANPDTTPYCFVQIGPPDTMLFSSPILLSVYNADSNATYHWRRNSTVVGSGLTYNVTIPGSYDVIETKANCSATSNILNIISYVSVAATASVTTVCSPGSSVLSASAQTYVSSYCTPHYLYSTDYGVYISLVSIDGTTLNNPSVGASSFPFYTMYPQSGATTTSLSGNTAYTMSVAGGFYPDCYIRGWIDYNQDGLFSASESIGVSGNVGALEPGSIIFNVPTNAYNGVTRLRLRSNYIPSGPGIGMGDACTNSDAGETEDYIITITNGVPDIITYSWTESPAGTTLQSNTTAVVNASNIHHTTTYTVTATTGQGCTSSASVTATVIASVPSTPTAINGKTGNVYGYCPGSTYTFSSIATNATGYTWSIACGTIVSGQGTNTVSVLIGSTCSHCKLEVKASNCKGLSAERELFLNSVLPAPTVSGPNSACKRSSSPETFTVSGTSSATSYTWSSTTSTIKFSTGGAPVNPFTTTATSVTVNFFGVATGTKTIQVRATNICGIGAIKNKNVNINNCSRMEGDFEIITSENSIVVFPNPAHDEMNIAFQSVVAGVYTLKVINITGQVVLSETKNAVEGNNNYVFNSKNLAAGLYTVILQSGETRMQTRMVKD